MLLLAGAAPAAGERAAQDADALARAGAAAIEEGRFGDALDAFTRAAALQPGDAGLCFGGGVAAFMLGRHEAARARFECALARRPDFLPAARWLGDLHYRAGRLDDAIAVYEAARERAPHAHDLQEQLARWRRERSLENRFEEVRSEHFTVRFERRADAALAREIGERLETARARIGGTLGVFPAHRIGVVLYTPEQFADITGLADWAAAGYDGRIRVPLAGERVDGDELDALLSHEYAHALIVMLGGRTVPNWLNEGLATALEPAGSEDAGAPPARPGGQPDLTRLHGSFVGLSRRDAEIAYESAAAAARRLLRQRGAGALVALLGDLSRGEPFERAFQRRMAMPYEAFAKAGTR